jgi:hypothetical protein
MDVAFHPRVDYIINVVVVGGAHKDANRLGHDKECWGVRLDENYRLKNRRSVGSTLGQLNAIAAKIAQVDDRRQLSILIRVPNLNRVFCLEILTFLGILGLKIRPI